MIGILLGSVAMALFIFHCITHYDKRGRILNKIHGPKVLPLLGNAHDFLKPLGRINF